jgi:hypothetical protein
MYDTSHSATEATCFKENGSLMVAGEQVQQKFIS